LFFSFSLPYNLSLPLMFIFAALSFSPLQISHNRVHPPPCPTRRPIGHQRSHCIYLLPHTTHPVVAKSPRHRHAVSPSACLSDIVAVNHHRRRPHHHHLILLLRQTHTQPPLCFFHSNLNHHTSYFFLDPTTTTMLPSLVILICCKCMWQRRRRRRRRRRITTMRWEGREEAHRYKRHRWFYKIPLAIYLSLGLLHFREVLVLCPPPLYFVFLISIYILVC